MPKMDGWEACRRIREVSDVCIIMLTARGQEGEKVKGLRLGADDYVAKLFSLKQLEARVGAVLRRTDNAQESAPALRGKFALLPTSWPSSQRSNYRSLCAGNAARDAQLG